MQNKTIRRSTVNPSDSASRLQPFLPVVELHFGYSVHSPGHLCSGELCAMGGRPWSFRLKKIQSSLKMSTTRTIRLTNGHAF